MYVMFYSKFNSGCLRAVSSECGHWKKRKGEEEPAAPFWILNQGVQNLDAKCWLDEINTLAWWRCPTVSGFSLEKHNDCQQRWRVRARCTKISSLILKVEQRNAVASLLERNDVFAVLHRTSAKFNQGRLFFTSCNHSFFRHEEPARRLQFSWCLQWW